LEDLKHSQKKNKQIPGVFDAGILLQNKLASSTSEVGIPVQETE
jgi:hypothetical protein